MPAPHTAGDPGSGEDVSASQMELVDRFVEALDAEIAARADPVRGAQQKKYMRGKWDHAGLSMPDVRVAAAAAAESVGFHVSIEADVRGSLSAALIRHMMTRSQREYHHVAVWVATKHAQALQKAAKAAKRKSASAARKKSSTASGGTGALLLPDRLFEAVHHAIVTHSWWDTVDALASNAVGPLVYVFPEEFLPVMEHWIDIGADDPRGLDAEDPGGGNTLWLRRAALLHQLSYKDETDPERLFRYCSKRMHEKDFFIRKAIGWALRTYGRFDPAAVQQFVSDNESSLSPLSQKEALKNIGGLPKRPATASAPTAKADGKRARKRRRAVAAEDDDSDDEDDDSDYEEDDSD